MKKFETPEIEVMNIVVEDVITTSPEIGGAGGDNELDERG